MLMLQFNREKVPERVVHARGMVAKGYFEVSPALLLGPTLGDSLYYGKPS